jgi:hypothetical protein
MHFSTGRNGFLKASRWVLTLAALSVAPSAFADTVVFSDDFEDGSVADWTRSTNFGGTTVIAASDGKSHTGLFGLETFLEVPPLSGSNLFVRATRTFVAPVAADYTLNLWAKSTACSGCTISYDVLVDGTSLTRTFAPSAFEERSFVLAGLTAGAHTLTLGMFTTLAVSGHFYSAFDDVVISTAAPVPEVSSLALLTTGLLLLSFLGKVKLQAA